MGRLIKKENGKQVGTIYHFTNISSLIGILKRDSLNRGGGQNTISFTRNKFFNNQQRQIGADVIQCRIALDGDMLSNKYKIKPFHDKLFFNNGYNPKEFESEERIQSDYISPIKPYITEITIFRDTVNFNIVFHSIPLPEHYNIENYNNNYESLIIDYIENDLVPGMFIDIE